MPLVDEHAVRELFDAVLASSIDPIMISRPDGAILRANPAACAALGRTETEIGRLGRQGIVVAQPGLDRLLAERQAQGHARGEVTFRRADGTTFPAEISSTLVHLPSSGPITLVIFRDVSERHALEQQLRESEERFRVAFHTLPDAVTLTDMESGRFVSVNAGAAVVTGWSPEEMVGRTADALGLWADADRPAFVERLRADGYVRDFRTHLGRKDGSSIDVVLSARPIVVGGQPLMLTVTRDVSQLAEAERDRDRATEQLRQSQKLEAVGRLAGGVAHDFNNLITVILTCAESLRDRLGPGPAEAREDVGEIEAAAERARDLTRQLLSFARRQVMAPVPLDLNEVVTASERLLRRVLGEDVALRVDPQRDAWTVCCDPVQLEQVIMNLAVNARDAMPAGGTLVLETRNVELDEAGCAPWPGATPGRHVRLAVRDDGTGMAPEVLERVFEPFFTTKPAGLGTGLGLATVHGIVRQSGGHIRMESTVGKGTTVECLFPAVPGPPVRGVAPRPAPARGGQETVLLVEDDAQVREVLRRALLSGGYRVLAARDGAEALALVLSGEPIQVVVADGILPGAGGREVVEAIRARRPEVAALLVSGHPRPAAGRDGPAEAGLEILTKPFTGGELLERIRQALDRRG